jgi:hypothetical protein
LFLCTKRADHADHNQEGDNPSHWQMVACLYPIFPSKARLFSSERTDASIGDLS